MPGLEDLKIETLVAKKLDIRVSCTSSPSSAKMGYCDQLVHPSVVKLHGKIVLAITPFPFSDPRFENPSIVVSEDMENWYEPVRNPLYPPPIDAGPNAHNADPELMYWKGKLYLYFARRSRSENTSSWLMLELNKDFSVRDAIKTNVPFTDGLKYVSLSLVPTSDIIYAWAVDASTTPFKVVAFYSSDGVEFKKLGETSLDRLVVNGIEHNIWHLSVRRAGDYYVMLAIANPIGTRNGYPPTVLTLYASSDGINFKKLSLLRVVGLDVKRLEKLYRSDFIIENGYMHVFLSYANKECTILGKELSSRYLRFIYREIRGIYACRSWHLALAHTKIPYKELKSSNVVD